MTFSHPVRVRYSEVDNQGNVFNTRYLEYVDHAVTTWLRQRGVAYEQMRETEWDFVVRHAECDWLAAARADELVDVTVEAVRFGDSSFEVLSEVRRRDDPAVPAGGPVLFRVTVVYVTVDPHSGEKQRTPDDIRRALQP